MSYPGNASLAEDIQSRILDTFQQTLSLVEKDSLKEAELGCDFILRLDPMFEPARWLQDRLSSSNGEIVLDDIRAAIAEVAAAAAEPPPGPRAVEDLEVDLDADLDLEAELEAVATETAAPPEAEASSEPRAEELEVELATPEPAAEPTAAGTQAEVFGGADSPVPATEAEVLDAPVAALDTESEQRIGELLGEGQAAFDRSEYQSAIDAWSRIFLIDIDHPEANERIEQARKLKAEAERSIEEAFHEALGMIDQGQLDGARQGLEKVLEMQPDHLMAREQLEKLDSMPAEAAEPVAAASAAAAAPVAPVPETQDILDDGTGDLGPALSEPDTDAPLNLDQLVTPDDLDAPAAPVPLPKPKMPQKPASSGGDKKKLLLYVGAAVLVLVAGGGWFLMSNWSKFFPNSAETVDDQRPDAIELAESLHAEGKTTRAIAQLKRLPPHHELYSEAQALVAQWEALADAQAADAGPTEADLAEFESLVDQARNAQARREFLRVDELLARAATIQPLDEAAANLQLVADAELEPLRSLIAIFQQGEWEMVLRELWRVREDSPASPDVNRLMTDSYYNLGVRALQRGDTQAAAASFDEALSISGSDAEIERVADFARTYQTRPEDLLFRIFVKYVPFR